MNGYLIIDFYILRDLLNVINNLFSNYNLDLFNQNIISDFDLDWLRDFDYFLYYLLHYNLNLDWFFYYPLYLHNFLFYDFNLFIMDLRRSVYYSFDNDGFFNFNYNLFNSLQLHFFWNLYLDLYNLLFNDRCFDNYFLFIPNDNSLFLNELYLFYNLSWNMYYFLKLYNLRRLYDLLYNFFNSHNLWYFDDPIHYLLYYFLNLDYLRHHSKYFKDIVNVDKIHDLGSNHSNNSFIYIKDCTRLYFYFLQLFQQCFNKYSQMELYFS